MRRAINASLFCLMSGACMQLQPVTFLHPTADQAQFERDRSQCIYEATAATGSYSSGATSQTISGAFAQGLGDGWTTRNRQYELTVLCIKAKGYTAQATAQP